MKSFDVTIIGGGPVGIFTIFQAGMLGMKACIIDGMDKLGGQCAELYPEKPIYDIPAFPLVTGFDLIENLKKQASRFEYETFLNTKVDKIEGNVENGFELFNDKNELICSTKVVIMSYGSGMFLPNKIPLQNAAKFEDKSLFYNVQKKNDFKNKNIVILGGGDSALDWTIELAEVAKMVTLIHRRDSFRAIPAKSAELQKLIEVKNVNLLIPFSLQQINGDEEKGFINNIEISNINTQEKTQIECDTLLAFFGMINKADLVKNCNLETKFNAVLVNKDTMESSTKGIFAIGDCAIYNNKMKLILTGFSEAATAVWSCYHYVFGKKPHFQHSTSMF
jgi:thioredoxin reductase (NADPH)